jgi:thiol:disulfide interchange protein DsbD
MRKWVRSLLYFISLLGVVVAPCHAEDDFLPPEKAFRVSARLIDAKSIEVNFQIAEGYYLYRERLVFKAEGASLGAPDIPHGKIKYDPNFEKEVETFRQQLIVRIPVQSGGEFTLSVVNQGCSDKGLCYAPMETSLQLSRLASTNQAKPNASETQVTTEVVSQEWDGEVGRIQASLASGKLSLILPLFFLLGLGLSLTPCVLPMVPILSFIIVGEGAQTSRSRGFILSLSYALGMAFVYTALGIAAGLLGEGLAATLQKPWLLTSFAVLIAVMSLAMFDVYQLQMPASLQLLLTKMSERQKGGKLFGVFIMGALSALIVGPCVAAPLAGALVYISQTRNVIIGGSALFVMALGMSVPLLLLGLSAGTLLPRAGQWMKVVKPLFGVVMLALALWMVASLIPSWVLMAGWGLLAISYGIFILMSGHLGWLPKIFGVLFVLLGAVQWLGIATGSDNPFAPWENLRGERAQKTEFKKIKTVDELDETLAGADGKVVMLDFYADWCVSCIEMEKLTFTEPAVKQVMDQMLLLQADVTANDADDKALLKRFGLFGPPGIIFFGRDSQEIREMRVIGFKSADFFLQRLQQVQSRSETAK